MSAIPADPAATTRRPGRPLVLSPDERRQSILRAAEIIFATSGYTGASMEAIARHARMSKKTIYAAFPGKQALFDALAEEMEPPAPTAVPGDAAGGLADLEAGLRQTARFAFSRRQLLVTRLLIAEGAGSGDMAERFYGRVIRQAQQHHARLIALLLESTGRTGLDPDQLARQLFGLVLGDLHVRLLMGAAPNDLEAQLEAQLRLALDWMQLLLESR